MMPFASTTQMAEIVAQSFQDSRTRMVERRAAVRSTGKQSAGKQSAARGEELPQYRGKNVENGRAEQAGAPADPASAPGIKQSAPRVIRAPNR